MDLEELETHSDYAPKQQHNIVANYIMHLWSMHLWRQTVPVQFQFCHSLATRP